MTYKIIVHTNISKAKEDLKKATDAIPEEYKGSASVTAVIKR